MKIFKASAGGSDPFRGRHVRCRHGGEQQRPVARLDKLEIGHRDQRFAGEHVQHGRPEDLDRSPRGEERLVAGRELRHPEGGCPDRFRRALEDFVAVGKVLLGGAQFEGLAAENRQYGGALDQHGVETIAEIEALAIRRFRDDEDFGLLRVPGRDMLLPHGVLGREAGERADRAEQCLDLQATVPGETLGEELEEGADRELGGDALVTLPGPSPGGGFRAGLRFTFQSCKHATSLAGRPSSRSRLKKRFRASGNSETS
jgi:hypothetical protein